MVPKVNFVLFSLSLVQIALGSDKIGDIEKCKFGDTSCLIDRFNLVTKNHKIALPALGLPPIEPFKILSLHLQNTSPDANKALRLDMKFNDISLYGLSQMKFTNVKGLEKTVGKSIEILCKIPKLTFTGKYEVDGRVLVVPVKGKGNFTLALEKCTARLRFSTKLMEKDGKTYLLLDKGTADTLFSKFHIQLDNLFNGDKILEDTTNIFLNENWQDVYNEVKPTFMRALETIARETFNGFFTQIPYFEAFLD